MADRVAKAALFDALASVAKAKSGMEKAAAGLEAIARQYGMWVMVCNCVGHCDDFDCGGGSAAWDKAGMLLGQLNDTEEGLLILDTAEAQVVKRATGNEIYEDH